MLKKKRVKIKFTFREFFRSSGERSGQFISFLILPKIWPIISKSFNLTFMCLG